MSNAALIDALIDAAIAPDLGGVRRALGGGADVNGQNSVCVAPVAAARVTARAPRPRRLGGLL